MNYNKYLFQLGFKNKFNFIPILLPVVFMLAILFMNSKIHVHSGYIPSLKVNIELLESISANDEKRPTTGTPSQEDLETLDYSNGAFEQTIEKHHKSIDYANEGNWRESLKLQLELLEESDIQNIEKATLFSEHDYKRFVYNKKATYEILAKENLEPEINGHEIKGITFAYRMIDNLFPAIFTLCMIAFFSNIFSSSLIDKMDIEDMFPVNQKKWQVQKIANFFLMGVFLNLIWISLAFLIAGLVNGFGSLNYPINLVTDNLTDTSPVISVMAQAALLQLLAILFLILAVYLIALLSKKSMSTLFISLITVVGPILLTGYLVPLSKYLHLSPTTYFHALRVVTNQLAFENTNPHIHLVTGLIVLSISSALLFGGILFIKVRHEQHQLFNRHGV